jgi:spore coat polysaccharide biosynthesis predicted glycosyltransferase SpsG/ribosomal protein S18 acetylase RimI-like enzyme
MRILLHCNGGAATGVGHVMRALALAEEAIAAGHSVTVVGNMDGEFVRRQVDAAGVDLVAVDRDACRRLVQDLHSDVVHVDSYDSDLRPATWLGAAARPLLSNVEDGAFGRRDADLVVDPNYGAEAENRPYSSGVVLRGSRYAPLRRAVTRRQRDWTLQPVARKVLVVMGGTDPMGMTGPALRLLGETGLPLDVTAVGPPSAAGGSEDVVERYPGVDVRFVAPTADLPRALVAQDLVLSAAGTSVWEMCCLGVPMALVATVENQRASYGRVVAAGAAVGLGTSRVELEHPVAVRALKDVLERPADRLALSDRARGIVDGLGAWRVVRAWEQLSGGRAPAQPVRALEVREASMADARALLDWRNDPATRAASQDSDEVTLEQHLTWLQATIGRDDRILLLASDAEGDVGTVRWDRLGHEAWVVSITAAPERRGQSLAKSLLEAGEEALRERTGGTPLVFATVHQHNASSRRLFASSGYLLDLPVDRDGFLRYAKRLP